VWVWMFESVSISYPDRARRKRQQ